ncbi:hypothetical protein [Naasia sp. SYSU D00948]|uniref:hypothetical protein n=1 Tax=Naasia sp. SYSU D00948 TaxID=2817379 RepID=UPI001B304E61|nr:hypothetical protein [Naasia sp. SYSU D00948]
MRRTPLGTASIVLAVAAVALWLFSYSWILGGLIPMDALVGLPVSPWLVGEVAAIPLGTCAVVLAVLDLRRRRGSPRAGVRGAAWAGGLAALLSLISVAWPASL